MAFPESELSSRLIVFIGPSGSGKDTLMVRARDQILAEDLNCHIAQRWISRDHDDTEQFRSISVEEFDQCINDNTFALHWRIYGNCYGVPSAKVRGKLSINSRALPPARG